MMAPVDEAVTGNDAALARLRSELEGPPYNLFLRPSAERADAEAGVVVVRLPFRPEFGRAAGATEYHGGVIAALIDLAAHAVVAVRIGRMAPTVDLRIDYLRPASGAALTATATLLRAGRSFARADVEIRNDKDLVVAVGRGTFSTL